MTVGGLHLDHGDRVARAGEGALCSTVATDVTLAPPPEKHQDRHRSGAHICHHDVRHHLPPEAPEDPHRGGIQRSPGPSETAAHRNEPLSEYQHGLQHELHLHRQTLTGAGQTWPGRAAQGKGTGWACPFPSPHSRRTFSPWGRASRRTSPAGSPCTHWTSLTVSAP